MNKKPDLKEATKNTDYKVKYEKRMDIFYRIRNRIDGLSYYWMQIMAPKMLQKRIMEIVRDSIFGGYLEIKNNGDRI